MWWEDFLDWIFKPNIWLAISCHQNPSNDDSPFPEYIPNMKVLVFFCVLSHKALPLENVRTYYITFHYPLNLLSAPSISIELLEKSPNCFPPIKLTHFLLPNFSSKKNSARLDFLKNFLDLLGAARKPNPQLSSVITAQFSQLPNRPGKRKREKGRLL